MFMKEIYLSLNTLRFSKQPLNSNIHRPLERNMSAIYTSLQYPNHIQKPRKKIPLKTNRNSGNARIRMEFSISDNRTA